MTIMILGVALLLGADKIDYEKKWDETHFKLIKMVEFASPYNHSKDQKGYVLITFELDKEITNANGYIVFYDLTVARFEKYYVDGKYPAKTKFIKIQMVDWPIGWYDNTGKFPSALIKSIKSKLPAVVTYDLVK